MSIIGFFRGLVTNRLRNTIVGGAIGSMVTVLLTAIKIIAPPLGLGFGGIALLGFGCGLGLTALFIKMVSYCCNFNSPALTIEPVRKSPPEKPAPAPTFTTTPTASPQLSLLNHDPATKLFANVAARLHLEGFSADHIDLLRRCLRRRLNYFPGDISKSISDEFTAALAEKYYGPSASADGKAKSSTNPRNSSNGFFEKIANICWACAIKINNNVTLKNWQPNKTAWAIWRAEANVGKETPEEPIQFHHLKRNGESFILAELGEIEVRALLNVGTDASAEAMVKAYNYAQSRFATAKKQEPGQSLQVPPSAPSIQGTSIRQRQ